ncbi:molybdopterin oxidoreductase [Amycolatopsis balhimycina DSM 5908]|uniref:Molybdopterin oxidoreductase n=1 Tax=Amycolatopsis balhimycina DSM 5908 TaxID=1081091 RepID=A0A428WEH6_AMYBA|nr:molybdopterin-dependent oxidoreductase [Amycolatopsis balhimycina]RSM41457.1 molybdopterin oxidoreductase [Amycolatopsis balhimycina DSM 5908]
MTTEVATFCPLCVSRCGATATVDDGRLLALRPLPGHPTGGAICVKGKAAPEIVAHPGRLLHPLRRTAPKGAADPGWERLGWDEALATIAARLTAIAAESGPEAVVFGTASPSTSAMSDSVDWLMRLRRAFGSPNLLTYMELCGWGRHLATTYTWGEPVPGAYLPDLGNAGCVLYWGYNPSVSRLAHATATTAALRRGAKLVVVDPRRAGLASKADHWLRVRPGTDGALALAITHVMIENGWYDTEFVERWTNASWQVRADTGELLAPGAAPPDDVPTRRVWDLIVDECARFAPEVAEQVTGVPAGQITAAARLLWEARPVAFYTWSGLEQQSNATQTVRAIGQLYALTGCLDVPGGNVLFTPVPANPVDGAQLLSPEQRAKAIGVRERPLGPARFEFVTGEDFYRAALDGVPYRARALVNFGANLVMAHGDSARGRDALGALDFFVHTDLFMSPTAEQADIVLPATSAWEAEALRIGFETGQDAQATVQLRRPLVAPRGEARPDLRIIFDLAVALGLGELFFGGDIEAAWRHQLAPSGVGLEQLRATPEGVRLPLETVHRKYERRGFRTPSGVVELYSEKLREQGYPPLPTYDEPSLSPRSRPDLAARYPLILTCAKSLFFCETQHREITSLRKSAPDPQVELHPETAAARGIAAGDWVRLETPKGSIRARAKFNVNLDPGVVCGQHGWWQPASELGQPGYPAVGEGSANLNLVLSQGPSDPISGSSPLRASLCEIRPDHG